MPSAHCTPQTSAVYWGSMLLLRALGVVYLLLSVYYARFFVERQEPTTLVQLVTLWCAAGWLLLANQPQGARAWWFRGWLPVTWQAWAIVLGALLIAGVVFVTVDRGSHSASDTLNAIAPTYALLASLVLRLRAERSLSAHLG
jgi:hypothetical protein